VKIPAKLLYLLAAVVFFIASLAACSRQPVEQLSGGEIVARSAERMKTLVSFEFLIQRSGHPTFLDYAETIIFSRAGGQYVAPDRVSTRIRIVTPGLVSEFKIVSISGQQWNTNLLTGNWEVMDPAYSFNPSILFNAESGIQAILSQDLSDPVLVGMEELAEMPGKKLYAVQASLQGGQVYLITYGMIDDQTLPVKLWVDPATFDLERLLLTDPVNPGDDEATTWQIDFWNFDQPFVIDQPVPGTK
jgi:hypothetical protein